MTEFKLTNKTKMEKGRKSTPDNSQYLSNENRNSVYILKRTAIILLTALFSILTHAQDYQYAWAHRLLDSVLPNGVLVSDLSNPISAITESPRAAVQDHSNNVVFTGFMYGSYADLSTSPPTVIYEAQNVIFMQKINPDGDIIWTNYIGGGDHDVSNTRVSRDIAVDSQGNIFICGYTYSDTTDFDPGPGEALLVPDSSCVGFIAKYTKDGDFSFVYPIQGNWSIDPYKIAVDDNDNVLVTGTFYRDYDFDGGTGVQRDTAFNLSEDNFLLKIDNTGQYVWHRTWGCKKGDSSNGIGVDEAGNSYVSCSFMDSIDTDPGAGTNILESNTTMYLNSYVSKFDASGNFVWSTFFKCDSSMSVLDLAYNAGKIAITGNYLDPIEVVWGASSHIIPEVTSASEENLFAIGLDTAGQYIWDYTPQATLKSEISSFGLSISANNEGWFLSMSASDSTDLDNTASVDAVLNSNYGSVHVVGLSEIGQYQMNKRFEFVQNGGKMLALWYVNIWNNDLCILGHYEDAALDVNPDPVEVDLLPKPYYTTTFLVKLTDVTKIPTIIGFGPESGPIGTSVTISGTNFDTVPANNTVYFGATQATVTSSSWSQLTATVPAGATYEPITVSVNGLSVKSAKPFTVTVAGDNVVDANMFNGGQLVDAGSEANKSVQGDLDKDGFSDLVVASGSDSTLSIFRNISEVGGEIIFESKVDFALAGQPADVTLADVYGNGYLDIIVSYIDYFGVSIFRNNGDGGFSKTKATKAAGTISLGNRNDFALPGFSTGIATGDLDGDGKMDMAAVDPENDLVHIFINTSTDANSVSFNLEKSIATGGEPIAVAIADIDNDLYPDLVMANNMDISISVILNNRLHTFENRQDFALTSKPWNIAIGDLDNNGKVDISVSCMTTPDDPSSMVRILANNSTPENISMTNFDITGLNPESVALNDINNDGKTDLVCSNSTDGLYLIKNTSDNGSLSFATVVNIMPDDVEPYAVACGDMNNDSESEVILPGKSKTTTKGKVEILKNLGSGNDFLSFSFAEQLAPATIDTANHTIDIDLVDCTDPTALIATFTLSPGATVAIPGTAGSTPVISGVTAWNYMGSVPFLVTSETNVNQIWIVTIHANSFAESAYTIEEACGSYTFDENVLTSSGIYEATFTNQEGCDSVVTLNLTIYEPSWVTDYREVFDSLTWIDGITYTENNNTATHTLTNQYGCDSTVILNLTILDSTLTGNSITSFSFAEQSAPATIDSVNHTIDIDLVDCTDPTALVATFTLSPGATAAIPGGMGSMPVTSDVTTYDYTDPVTFLVTSGMNVNEIWIVTVHANYFADNVTISKDTCSSYTFDGNVLTADGVYQATFTNQQGCDSVVTLYLNILEPSMVTDYYEVYDSLTWIDGITYKESNNTATYTLTNQYGCDSIVTLDLFVLDSTLTGNSFTSFIFAEQSAPATIDTINHTIDIDLLDCTDPTALVATFEVSPGATVVIQGGMGDYSVTSGVTPWNYTNSVDFVVTSGMNVDQLWIVTIHANSFADNVTVYEDACESYTFDGNVLTTSGVYQATFTNQNGCDSLVTLNLNILEPSTGTDIISACESYTWIDGVTYTESNYTATHTLTNAIGCDSVVTLNLTIGQPESVTANVSTCGNYEFDGNLITSTGQYVATFTNQFGCDSVVTLNLTIGQPEIVNVEVSACGGYEFTGNILTASGQYQETYTNQNGCDSVVNLDLTILEPSSGTDIISACESYTWIDGITYTESNNSATYTLTNSVGCDSVVTLNLTILEPSTRTDIISACESYTWIDGVTYTESNNTATYTLTNAVGCDSIIMLDLTLAETCTSTSISGISNNDFRVYPNPVSDHLVVELPSADFNKIEIHDITGKIVLTQHIEGKEAIIENLNFENGTYILRIIGKNQSVNTFLLIKN